MKILIAGNFFVSDNFKNKGLQSQCTIDELNKADLCLVNQEALITEHIHEK